MSRLFSGAEEQQMFFNHVIKNVNSIMAEAVITDKTGQ